MPVKNATKRPQHVIDEAVRKYFNGESAGVLAKLYKVSKPAMYNWIAKAKQAKLEAAARMDMSPKQLSERDREALLTENKALKDENAKLRNKVVSLMIKAGEM
jgi:transposase